MSRIQYLEHVPGAPMSINIMEKSKKIYFNVFIIISESAIFSRKYYMFMAYFFCGFISGYYQFRWILKNLAILVHCASWRRVFFSRRRVFFFPAPSFSHRAPGKKTPAPGKKNPAPESTMDQNRNIPRNLSKLDTIISNNYSSRNPPRVLPATVSQRFQTGGEVKKHGTFWI